MISELRLPAAAAILAAAATLAAGVLAAPSISDPVPWKKPEQGHAWIFPRDHWVQEGYRTEWWYLTGHLTTGDVPPRDLGYQLTFFRVGLHRRHQERGSSSAWSARDLVMAHAAVSDYASSTHRFSDLLVRAIPLLGGFGAPLVERIAWSRAPAGTDGEWSIAWNGDGFDFTMRDDVKRMGFNLATRPLTPVTLQGPGGVSRKGAGAGAASLYYSFTRLETSGEVRLDDRAARVEGISWMDREIASAALEREQAGWDWFSLQLDDGRDLMLYVMRRVDGGESFRSATLVSPGHPPRYLDPGAWTVRPKGTWTSQRTGIAYPSGWDLEIPADGIRLSIVPRLPDSENVPERSPRIIYWEGAARLASPDGRSLGRAYVELTGYGKGTRPPL